MKQGTCQVPGMPTEQYSRLHWGPSPPANVDAPQPVTLGSVADLELVHDEASNARILPAVCVSTGQLEAQAAGALGDGGGAHVGRHHQQRVGEGHGAALRPTTVERVSGQGLSGKRTWGLKLRQRFRGVGIGLRVTTVQLSCYLRLGRRFSMHIGQCARDR